VEKGPPLAGFCDLGAGLQAPDSAVSGTKTPKVSGGLLNYSRFWETATGDRVRSALRGGSNRTRRSNLFRSAVWPKQRILRVNSLAVKPSGSSDFSFELWTPNRQSRLLFSERPVSLRSSGLHQFDTVLEIRTFRIAIHSVERGSAVGQARASDFQFAISSRPSDRLLGQVFILDTPDPGWMSDPVAPYFAHVSRSACV
jgi:hypothetical protein